MATELGEGGRLRANKSRAVVHRTRGRHAKCRLSLGAFRRRRLRGVRLGWRCGPGNPMPLFLRNAVVLDCGLRRAAIGVFSRKGSGLRLERIASENFSGPVKIGESWREQVRDAIG